jgi:hypothetical protein
METELLQRELLARLLPTTALTCDSLCPLCMRSHDAHHSSVGPLCNMSLQMASIERTKTAADQLMASAELGGATCCGIASQSSTTQPTASHGDAPLQQSCCSQTADKTARPRHSESLCLLHSQAAYHSSVKPHQNTSLHMLSLNSAHDCS